MDDQVPINNGRFGNTPGNINSTEFLAWNESSRITLRRAGELDTLTAVRQVKLHEPASGIGLPEFSLSGSTTDYSMLGDPLTYTILDNQDLTVDDAQVRNLTLALTEPITEPVNRFHIQFSLTDNIQQFAVSEVQLCSNESKLLRFIKGNLHTCMWLKYLSPTAVTIEAESLTLELESEPLTGPHILLPANRLKSLQLLCASHVV